MPVANNSRLNTASSNNSNNSSNSRIGSSKVDRSMPMGNNPSKTWMCSPMALRVRAAVWLACWLSCWEH